MSKKHTLGEVPTPEEFMTTREFKRLNARARRVGVDISLDPKRGFSVVVAEVPDLPDCYRNQFIRLEYPDNYLHVSKMLEHVTKSRRIKWRPHYDDLAGAIRYLGYSVEFRNDRVVLRWDSRAEPPKYLRPTYYYYEYGDSEYPGLNELAVDIAMEILHSHSTTRLPRKLQLALCEINHRQG